MDIVWGFDFICAIGFVLHSFAISPMRMLAPGEGLVAALKADSLSLPAWQLGMSGGMAILQFAIFRPVFGAIASVGSPGFWFAMQLAMLGGFLTTYPVNGWLIRAGRKEQM